MRSRSVHQITSQMIDSSFLEEVMRVRGGEKILDCMQCGVCGGSCPARFAMDFTPMQIIKMVQLGLKDIVLSSSTIWICASCYACTTRCPREIDIPLLMSGLKNIAMKEKIPSKIEIKPRFHRSFTELVKKYGRMHEPELFMKLTKKSDIRKLLHNAIFGFKLFRKGKLKLRAPEINEKIQLLKIFEIISEEKHE